MSESMTIYCALPTFEELAQMMISKPGWVLLQRAEAHIHLRSPEGDMRVHALVPAVGGEFGRVCRVR